MNYDVIIIGAGPGGIFSAFELVKQKPELKVAVFEAGQSLEKRRCPIDGEKRDVFSPQQNIEAGCKYLSYLLRRFKVTETVLAAYNAGEGTVSLWLKTPEYSADGINLKEIPYSETRLYVGKVMRRAEFYENMLK